MNDYSFIKGFTMFITEIFSFVVVGLLMFLGLSWLVKLVVKDNF